MVMLGDLLRDMGSQQTTHDWVLLKEVTLLTVGDPILPCLLGDFISGHAADDLRQTMMVVRTCGGGELGGHENNRSAGASKDAVMHVPWNQMKLSCSLAETRL